MVTPCENAKILANSIWRCDDFGMASFGYARVSTDDADRGRGCLRWLLSAAAAPAPSTWAMLVVGFAGLGFVGYRGARRREARGEVLA